MVWPVSLPAITNLIDFCDEARDTKHSWEQLFENVTLETDFNELKDRSADPFVYIFKMVRTNTHEVKVALDKHKKDNHKKYPRVNKNASQFLYVGSSRRNVLGRIRQHLGKCPNATHALKLSDWFTDFGHVHLYVRKYNGINPTVLQILEDSISEKLKPMFEKQGGNGR